VFKEGGLQELRVQIGTGEKRRIIPLHVLVTGDNALRKIGTKPTAAVPKPVPLLSRFGESVVLSDADIYLVELYLVHV
jgi:hypothetical protein